MQNLVNEKWVPLTVQRRNLDLPTRFQISNYGRIRNQHKELLKTRLEKGYPAINLKLYIEPSPATDKSFKKLRLTLNKIGKEMSSTKALLKNKNAKANIALHKERKKSLGELLEEYNSCYKKFHVVMKKRNKESIVNVGGFLHRFTASHFLTPASAKHLFVIHLDYKRTNNFYKNLKWVTKEEMESHQQKSPFVIDEKKKRKGRIVTGKIAKLTSTRVMLIKKKIESGKLTRANIAKQFGVSAMQITRIARGENWAWVKN